MLGGEILVCFIAINFVVIVVIIVVSNKCQLSAIIHVFTITNQILHTGYFCTSV